MNSLREDEKMLADVARAICRARGNCHPHPCDVRPEGGCIDSVCMGPHVYRDEAAAAAAVVSSRHVAQSDGADAADLREALATLEKSATYVAKLGARPGPQWVGLGSALIRARNALGRAAP